MTGPWIALAITLAIQALVSMALLVLPAMAPAMAALLGVSPALIGTYVAVVYAGAMVASMLSGPLVLRFGAIAVSQAGLLACAAGLALLALSPTLWAATVGALLIGIGYGPITPASSHLLARTTPPHRASLVFSIKQTGVPLGGVMAGALVPPLVVVGGPPAALWATAAGCVLCALVSQPLRSALDADRDPDRALTLASLAGPMRLVITDRVLRRLASFSLVFSAVQMCLAAFLVTYLHETLGYSLLAAGAALAAAQAGGVVGRVLWGWLSDRWVGATRMLGIVAALMLLSTVAMAALPPEVPKALVLLLVVVFGASATGWNGVYLAEVARQAPAGQASAATGGSLAITFCGVVLGPILFAGISGLFDSYRVGYLVLALPTALCCWGLLRSAKVRAPDTSDRPPA